MRKMLWGTLAAAAVCSAMPAWSQDDDLFAKLDANKDGFVTADEVEGDRKSLFERMLRTADKDADKKLNKEEFQAGLKGGDKPREPLGGAGAPGRPGGGQFNPQEIFARADGNSDGKLSKDEAPPPLKAGFERLDADSDGFISKEEFGRGLAAFGRPGGAPGAGAEAAFDSLDANKDGKVTKEEMPEDRREQFARISERLGSDALNKEQFVRAMAMMAQAGRPGAGAPEGPPPGRSPLFVALDADGDNELSSGEIEAAAKSLLKLDKDSNGKLSREEMFPPMSFGRPGDRPGEGRPDARPGEGLPARNAQEFLARLREADANKDGKISKEEAPPLLKERFDRIDANSDGFIDETELRQVGGDRRPEGGRPEGRRPNGDRPEGARRPDGDRPRDGARRPEGEGRGDRRPNGEPRPERRPEPQ